MILGLAQSLFQLFREHSDVVSVSKLRRQGVRSVTVLDWDRIEELISRAVEEALQRRGIELSPDARRSVNQEALEAFHRLVEQRDQLAESAQSLEEERNELNANLEAVRGQLDRARGELDVERTRRISADDVLIAPDRFERYAERLATELARVADGGEDPSDLPDSLRDVAQRLLAQEREQAMTRARAQQEERVQLLERRIAKLQGTLDRTEDVVKKLRDAREVDPGIESIYREVQGLDAKDNRYEEKKGVLEDIFKLNVSLREVLAEGDDQAVS